MSDYSSNQQATPPSKKVAGRWTRTEHDRFIKALEKFGRDWISVQKFVRTRSLSQVRSHAQKFFMKISPDDISAMIAGEEDSDFYTSNPGHETAYHQKNRGKKNATRFDYPVKSLNSQKKPVQSEKKEDLLQIFKRAIDMEMLEINNQNVENSAINCSSNKSLCTHEHLSEEQSEYMRDAKKSETVVEDKQQPMFQDTKQIEFILPDFAQLFHRLDTLAH